MPHIVNRDSLLQNLSEEIAKLPPNVSIGCIVVKLTVDGYEGETDPDYEVYEFDLKSAIEILANDLYWDERGNWSNATQLTIDVM